MASIWSWNRTAAPGCSARVRRIAAGSRRYTAASALAYTSIRGAARSSVARKSCIGASAAVISGLWKAAETARRRAVVPSAVSRSCRASTAGTVPETTVCPGAFRFAIQTSAGLTRSITACTAPGPASTASIVPGSASIRASSSPRRRARRSRLAASSTPAACSATSSPRLCPATQSGSSPIEVSSASTDRLCAASAGCAQRVSVSRCSWAARWSSVKAGGGKTTSLRPRPAAASHTSWAAGTARARSAPIPTYCEPWPGKTNAIRPGSAGPHS